MNGDAPVEDIADDQNQQGAGEEAAEVQHHPQALVIELAPGGQGMIFHVGQSSFFRLIKTLRNTLISMMKRNSTRPMENRALRWREPTEA